MTEKRDSKGKFMKGHTPPKSPGRPLGTRNMPKPPQIERMAQVRAAEMLTEMIGKASDVVDCALTLSQEVILMDADGGPQMDEDGNTKTIWVGGDAQTARWLMDRTLPKDFSMLTATIDTDVSTISGIIQASEDIIANMLNRTLPLEQCERVLKLLSDYASIRAYEGIEELKTIILKHEAASSKAAKGGTMPEGLTPMWGRLMEHIDPANQQPAE